MHVEELGNQISRAAVRFNVGGFRPEVSPRKSWFGKVLLGKKGEDWPVSSGKKMIPVCQLNLTELPLLPEKVRDIAFITLFIDQEYIPSNEENGNGWLIKTYESLSELVEIDQPEIESPIKPFQMMPELIEKDYPCWEDCPIEIPVELEDEYDELFPNQEGIKIGGWPTLIQSEIYWAARNEHSVNPEYVLQIDSVEKANWYWGDNGVAYIGRGTKPGKENIWTFEWQCY